MLGAVPPLPNMFLYHSAQLSTGTTLPLAYPCEAEFDLRSERAYLYLNVPEKYQQQEKQFGQTF
jgi:hypothetical protein